MRSDSLLVLLLLSATLVHVSTDCAGSECFDIVFIMDGTGSGSDVPDKFNQALLFMSNVANRFKIGSSDTLFGLYVVGMGNVIALPFYNTAERLQDKIKNIVFQRTQSALDIYLALDTVRYTYFNGTQSGRRQSSTCVVVLLVGGPGTNPTKQYASAELLKQDGINLYAIKIGNFSSSQLEAIVSDKQFLFDGLTIGQLNGFQKPLVTSIKEQEKCKTITVTISDDIYKQADCLDLSLFCTTWIDRNTNRLLELFNVDQSRRITDYLIFQHRGIGRLLCFHKDVKNVIRQFKGIIRADKREFDSIAVTVNIVEINDAPVLKSDTISVYFNVAPGTKIPIDIEDPDTAAPATDITVTLKSVSAEFSIEVQNSKDWFIVIKTDLRYKDYTLYLEIEDNIQRKTDVQLTVITMVRPDCDLPTEPFETDYPGYNLFIYLNQYCPITPQKGDKQRPYITFEMSEDYVPGSCILDLEVLDASILTVLTNVPPSLKQPTYVQPLLTDGVSGTVSPLGELAVGNNDVCSAPVIVRMGVESITMDVSIIVISCAPSTDNKGTMWKRTTPGIVSKVPCDSNNVGSISRTCSQDGVFLNPQYDCTRMDISRTTQTINSMIDKIIKGDATPVNVSELNEALDNMLNETMPQETSLQEGDIKNVQSVLDNIANQTVYTKIKTDVNFSTLLGIADNLIDTNNLNTWSSLIQNEDTGAETIVGTVDTLVNSMVTSFDQMSESRTMSSELLYSKKNLVVTITPTSTCQDAITRDDKSYYNLRLGCENVGKALSFSSVAYKDMSKLITTKRLDEGNASTRQPTSSNNTLTVNTAVISCSLSTNEKTKLVTPVVVIFKPIKPSRTDAVCVSMDTYKTGVKYWTSSGCRTSRSSTGHVVCECDYLSNFAVLMSTYGTPPEDAFALMVISYIGCILSIICAALTVIIYAVLWLKNHRPIQTERSKVLINLCCALFIANIIFIAGVSRTSNKDGCTAIAVVLHYMFLVVIFALLGEGVMLAGMVLFPLKQWRTGRYTIPLSWGCPVIILAMSMGITQLQGYGDKKACWLSRDTGLIWAFIAPVLFVIIINLGIMVMVFRTMLQTSAFKNKSEKERAKIGLRNLCILVPVMGITWILGVFAVDENTVVFQYLFTIFNSLQGVFIFLMHCVFNRQVQEALKMEKDKLSNTSEQDTFTKPSKSMSTTNENMPTSETDTMKEKQNTGPYRNKTLNLKT